MAVFVPGFLALGWWQLNRALSGNTLSWAYTFEWPLFAGYLLYVWRRLRRHPPPEEAVDSDTAQDERVAAGGEEEDEELAAYNSYLSALEESGRRKHW